MPCGGGRRATVDHHEQRRPLVRRPGSTSGLRGQYSRAWATAPSAVGKSNGSGDDHHASSMPRSRGGTRATGADADVGRRRPPHDVGLGGRRGADEQQLATRSTASPSNDVCGTSSMVIPPSRSSTASCWSPSSVTTKATRPSSRNGEARLAERPSGGKPTSRPSSTIASTPVVGRPAVEAPEAAAVAAEPQRPVGRPRRLADRLPGASPPATTVRVEPSETTSRVASHGMSGWSHSSHHQARPSGRQRGDDTKSGPADDDLGVRRLVRRPAARSCSPPRRLPAWHSCTHRIVEPSGETSPSA